MTGANGAVGTAVVQHLLKQGARVAGRINTVANRAAMPTSESFAAASSAKARTTLRTVVRATPNHTHRSLASARTLRCFWFLSAVQLHARGGKCVSGRGCFLLSA